MLLSQVISMLGDAAVVRDGEFAWLGKTRDSGLPMLTFAESLHWLDEACGNSYTASVIVTPELVDAVQGGYGIVASDDPRGTFYDLHERLAASDFYGAPFATRVHPSAFIAEGARVSPVDVKIDAGCMVDAGATIMPGSVLGQNCHIYTGAVIGSQGFEVRRKAGGLRLVTHIGRVRLHSGVEVHASYVDRAPFGETSIGDDTKIDNLCHIGHGCRLGRRNILTAGAIFGGNVLTGDDVWFGLNATIRDSVWIGPRARVNMGAVVTKNVQVDEAVSGNWALPHERHIEHMRRER